MNPLLLCSLPLLATPALAGDGCSASKAQTVAYAETADIVDTAVAAGKFNTLAKALGAADLVATLQGDGPFTVFAPTDAAFAKLPHGTLEALLQPDSKQRLADILTFHVVAGNVPAKKVVELANVTTVNGQRAPVVVEEGGVSIGGARVVQTDIHCSNGVIHVIDTVLLPSESNLVETAAGAGTFKTLLAAAKAAGLADTLATGGPFTLFAPSDAAFAALPEGVLASLLEPENKDKLAGILKYHLIEGRVYSDQAARLKAAPTLAGHDLAIAADDHGLTVGGARVKTADLETRNGVIHVIDKVLLPQ